MGYEATTNPYHQQADEDTGNKVEGEKTPVFVLQQQEHIVGKGGEGSETATEAGDKENIHGGRKKMGLLCQSEEDSDKETTYDVDDERTVGKRGCKQVVGQLAYQVTAAGSDETAGTGDEHCFKHILLF